MPLSTTRFMTSKYSRVAASAVAMLRTL